MRLLEKLWGTLVEFLCRGSQFKRAEFFVSKVSSHFEGCKTVLDLGCGAGHIGVTLAKKCNFKVTLVDTKPPFYYIGVWLLMRPCAKILALKRKLRYKIYDGRKLKKNDLTYDAVLLSFVLPHTANPEAVLLEARRLARKRIVLLEDIHRNWLDRILNPIADLLINLEIPCRRHRNRSEEEWREVFKRLGLKVVYTEFWGGPRFPNTLFVLDKK